MEFYYVNTNDYYHYKKLYKKYKKIYEKLSSKYSELVNTIDNIKNYSNGINHVTSYDIDIYGKPIDLFNGKSERCKAKLTSQYNYLYYFLNSIYRNMVKAETLKDSYYSMYKHEEANPKKVEGRW
ncbi:hypothetical protein ACH36K_10620 [Clostridium sp. MB05]